MKFSPHEDLPKNQLNLFGRYPVNPIEGDCKPFLDFMQKVICDENKGHIAKMLQEPNYKNGVAVVLYGEKGTGKSFLTEHIGFLLGQYSSKVEDHKHFLGNFNAHLETTIMLVIEELSWQSNMKDDGKLKELITGNSWMIERKYVTPYLAKNFIHVFINTNSAHAIPATPGERRYFIMKVNSKYKKNTVYFAKLHNWFESGGNKALMHYFMNYDYSDVDLRQAPISEALWHQKYELLEVIDKGLYELLKTGGFTSGRKFTEIMSKKTVVKEFHEMLKGAGYTPKGLQSRIGKRLKKAIPLE